ncbi:MAG TPA: hypothetical protein DCK78_13745 [Paenibacillus lactis]|nr:hypothetical protein [Paenibacillus lactis]
MNRNDYKKLINRIEPDQGLEERLMNGIREKEQEKHPPIRRSRIGMAGVGAAVMLGVVLVISIIWQTENTPIAEAPAVTPTVSDGQDALPGMEGPRDPAEAGHEKVELPAIELPKDDGVMMDMIGLVVYKGNIYTQTGTQITAETAKELRGEKLGRTTAGITEWSTQADYTELASTIGEADIYAVQGYDETFRIMSYEEHDGQVFAELYEHLNGITVMRGEDIAGKLKLDGRIASAQWQDFDSWNMGETRLEELPADASLDAFIKALYEAKPVAENQLMEAGIYDAGSGEQKFLYLNLEDGTKVELRLFKSGPYAKYSHAQVFFEMDAEAFGALWDRME